MRSEEGAYLVDGPLLLDEALDAGVSVRSVYVESDASRGSVHQVVDRAATAGVRVQQVVPGALAKVLDLGSPQSVVAVVTQHPSTAAAVAAAAGRTARPLLVLVDVADPGNVGTLVRVAEAAGCAGVVLVGECADLYNPKTVRATAGAVFRVPVAAADAVAALRPVLLEAGVGLLGTVGRGGVSPEAAELGGAVGLLIGSEAHGLPPEVVAACDQLVTIPMEGAVESLNAAVAGSVLAFEAARRRRTAPLPGQVVERSGEATTPVGHNDDPVATGRPGPVGPSPEHGSPPR